MRRRPRRFFVAGLLVVALVFVTVAGAIVSAGLYDRLTKVKPDCGGGSPGNTPASFEAWIDTTPYLMPDFEEVRFPSRDPAISISAWWVAGSSPDAPAVVLAHGMHECKRSTTVLVPAGMLHRHGYAVLVIDLRNHGSSTVDNGRITGGAGEARDILGAWDWLRAEQGIPADRIGILGTSLGAGAAIIASGEEPEVAAIWADSGFADLTEVLRHQVAGYGLPFFMADLAIEVGRLRGEDIATRPIDSLDRLAGRPIAIVAGEDDGSIPVDQARRLADAARAHGSQPLVWILPGVGHTWAMRAEPAEYERRLIAFFDGSLGGTARSPSP
jgi:dipeptidyl aminopeptidase/acylaminoacyl peptidase